MGYTNFGFSTNCAVFAGMIVTYPGKKPASLRVDQLDRDQPEEKQTSYDSDTTIKAEPIEKSSISNCTLSESRLKEHSKQFDNHTNSSGYQASSRCSSPHSVSSSRTTVPRYSKTSRSSSPVSSKEKLKQTSKILFPMIVHFGIRPPQLSYAGNPE